MGSGGGSGGVGGGAGGGGSSSSESSSGGAAQQSFRGATAQQQSFRGATAQQQSFRGGVSVVQQSFRNAGAGAAVQQSFRSSIANGRDVLEEEEQQELEQKAIMSREMNEILMERVRKLSSCVRESRSTLQCDVDASTDNCTAKLHSTRSKADLRSKFLAASDRGDQEPQGTFRFVLSSGMMPSKPVLARHLFGDKSAKKSASGETARDDRSESGSPSEEGAAGSEARSPEDREAAAVTVAGASDRKEQEQELHRIADRNVTLSVENVQYSYGADRAPFKTMSALMMTYVRDHIALPPHENVSRCFSGVLLSPLVQRMYDRLFWYNVLTHFSRPLTAVAASLRKNAARRDQLQIQLQQTERDIASLREELAGLYIQFIQQLQLVPDLKRDYLFRYIPFAIAHAILVGLRYLCPGSRHLYTAALQSQIYETCSELLHGIRCTRMSITKAREVLFPFESRRVGLHDSDGNADATQEGGAPGGDAPGLPQRRGSHRGVAGVVGAVLSQQQQQQQQQPEGADKDSAAKEGGAGVDGQHVRRKGSASVTKASFKHKATTVPATGMSSSSGGGGSGSNKNNNKGSTGSNNGSGSSSANNGSGGNGNGSSNNNNNNSSEHSPHSLGGPEEEAAAQQSGLAGVASAAAAAYKANTEDADYDLELLLAPSSQPRERYDSMGVGVLMREVLSAGRRTPQLRPGTLPPQVVVRTVPNDDARVGGSGTFRPHPSRAHTVLAFTERYMAEREKFAQYVSKSRAALRQHTSQVMLRRDCVLRAGISQVSRFTTDMREDPELLHEYWPESLEGKPVALGAPGYAKALKHQRKRSLKNDLISGESKGVRNKHLQGDEKTEWHANLAVNMSLPPAERVIVATERIEALRKSERQKQRTKARVALCGVSVA